MAATAWVSGRASRLRTSASAGATAVVSTPPRPSARAASRMFQTSGYTEAPVTKPTRSMSLSMEATVARSTVTTRRTGTSPMWSNRENWSVGVAIASSGSTLDGTTELNGVSPAAVWAA